MVVIVAVAVIRVIHYVSTAIKLFVRLNCTRRIRIVIVAAEKSNRLQEKREENIRFDFDSTTIFSPFLFVIFTIKRNSMK